MQKQQESNVNPPIIMKIDAPADEADKEGLEDNKSNENSVLKACSPNNVNAKPFPSTNPFASTATRNNQSRGILKPPQLSLNNTSSNNKTPFILNPSKLNLSTNPFGKATNNSDNGSENSHSSSSNGDNTPKFVPLVVKEKIEPKTAVSQPKTTETASSTTTSSSTFVFGQNLEERVVTDNEKSSESKNSDNSEPKPSTSLNGSGGTSEMLFSSAVKTTDNNGAVSKEQKSLSESAREYEESRANKRKYEEVRVITGEEDEKNILSISCKLFAFDKVTGSWQERGRGTLRLNDFEDEHSDTDGVQSRLVFRTSGSLRVILNTKIWAEMTVEQASEKSIRITALDADGGIKVFLIMANIEDSKQLFANLQSRVQREIGKRKRFHIEDENSGDKN